MPIPPKNLSDFKSLVEVVEALRGPNGCPWDKEQTHQTLTQFALEEAFELAEAIDSDETPAIVEELGDMLFQVVLHAEIGRQENRFTLSDVIYSVSEKMTRRHPHVFADTKVKDSDEVIKNWQQIKVSEQKKVKGFGIPENLPALIRSQKIGAKTKKFNFDWSNIEGVLEKVEEELLELKEAIAKKPLSEQQHELGDLLFSVAQLARHLDFDAEQALRQTNQRFEKRFQMMKTICESEGNIFTNQSPTQLEQLWQKAKKL